MSAVVRADAGELELKLMLVHTDGGVALERPATLEREISWSFEVAQPDRYGLVLSATCGGRELAGQTFTYPVYERLELDHTLARGCGRLTRLSSELLECDGLVVSSDGGPALGFLASNDTRPVLRDGGFVRWLRAGGLVRLEADGVVLEAAVAAGPEWLASPDFAVLGSGTLVVRGDAGLETFSFDAGLEPGETFCAVASDVRGSAVLRCNPGEVVTFDAFNGSRSLRACSLELGPGTAALSGCVDLPGAFVRQEPTSRYVLTSQGGWSLRWIDLLGGEVSTQTNFELDYFHDLKEDDLHYGLSPTLFDGRNGTVLLSRESSKRWLYTSAARASAELAWRSDGGTTWWAVVP